MNKEYNKIFNYTISEKDFLQYVNFKNYINNLPVYEKEIKSHLKDLEYVNEPNELPPAYYQYKGMLAMIQSLERLFLKVGEKEDE